MADLNKLAKKIFEECKADGEPVTMEDALEMAKMEINAKEDRGYTTTETTKTAPRKPRERKVDDEKKKILSEVKVLIEGIQLNNGETANAVMKTETELSFPYNGNEYTLKLTKHRPPKK